NHLPVDAQVPAGFGTANGACAPIRLPRRPWACPSAGLDGCGQSGRVAATCQSLHPDKAIFITKHHKRATGPRASPILPRMPNVPAFARALLLLAFACPAFAGDGRGAAEPAAIARLRIEPADGEYLAWADNL